MSSISNTTNQNSLAIVPYEPRLAPTGSLDERIDACRKTLESQYLATYKALHLGGKETLESRMIRLAARDRSPINSLPQELRTKIFSYLDPISAQNTTSLNQMMRPIAIESTNLSIALSLKNFTNLLITRLTDLEGSDRQRDWLNRISIPPQNFKNLKDLKDYIFSVKKQLIEIIKTIDEETSTTAFGNIDPPDFIEEIFELATFERRIDEANILHTLLEKQKALIDVFMDLAQGRHTDRAIEVIKTIPINDQIKFEIILEASLHQVKSGNTRIAIALANSIPIEEFRNTILIKISEFLAEDGKVYGDGEAMAVARMIVDQKHKDIALYHICASLATAGKIYGNGEAMDVARMIIDQEHKDMALGKICDSLAMAGKIFGDGEALAVAKMISDAKCSSFSHKPSAFACISSALLNAKKIEESIAIALTIDNPYFHDHALCAIFHNLEAAGQIQRAREIVSLIKFDSIRTTYLSY